MFEAFLKYLPTYNICFGGAVALATLSISYVSGWLFFIEVLLFPPHKIVNEQAAQQQTTRQENPYGSVQLPSEQG